MTPDDFTSFFRAVTGHRPFPWQRRLARSVLETGHWPDVLDLPTGAGKTAVIAVAVFAMAVDAGLPVESRRAYRRVALVVDRRVVVDQGHAFACRIAEALARSGPSDGILYDVAQRLRSLDTHGVAPLEAVVLRGGMALDPSWIRSPCQPLVVSSTVDQIGSRLLFRGYGVRDGMRPVHAGVLSHDTLVVLDEVHLSRPFAEMLAQIERYAGWSQVQLPRPVRTVHMSATPSASGGRRFSLDVEDLADPVLSARIHQRKPTNLHLVDVPKKADETEKRVVLARHAATAAGRLVDDGHRAVGVVVNRVDTARYVLRALVDEGVPCALLTGRMRAIDRDRVVSEIWGRVAMGRDVAAPPLVLVATQCVEAGADLDLDALVTECASWDSLRQRLGRLARSGRSDGDDPYCVIMMRSDLTEIEDPVYGWVMRNTWGWLTGLVAQKPSTDLDSLPPTVLDLGIAAAPIPPDGLEVDVMRTGAPTIPPSYLDIWSETMPAPAVEPDISLWLHGTSQSADDVRVVWRADLSPVGLGLATDGDQDAQDAIRAALSVCPPSSLESLGIPVGAVRSWLSGASSTGPSDTCVDADTSAGDGPEARPVVRWRGDDTDVVVPTDIAPGDTVVVPTSYGGLTYANWDPDSTVPVGDLGDLAAFTHRGRPTLRLHRSVGIASVPPVDPESGSSERRDDALEYARVVAGTGDPTAWPAVAGRGVVTGPSTVHTLQTWTEDGVPEEYLAVVGPRVAYHTQDSATTEQDAMSFVGTGVSLSGHLGRVGDTARMFALDLGLPTEIADDLALAGWLHDVGKADPRFQRWLCGGSAVLASSRPEPLAKSIVSPVGVRGRRIARELSGYPAGARHEIMSVAMVQDVEVYRDSANDWDLVLHLVGSHHGWCRPAAPAVPEPDDIPVSLVLDGQALEAGTRHRLASVGSGITDRFWALTTRYGWHGLAWLESVLRLADHRVSALEERGEI